MSPELPTTRIGRSGKVGRLAAEQAVRHAGTLAANLTRSEEERREALSQRYLDAADQMVAVLGTMKGAAMKIGQMLSVLDLGLVPEEARPEFQRKLAALRDSAPKVSFDDMRGVIEDDLKADLGSLFANFDPHPVAAASIGQVYVAELADGREVAVKVQYPGVATAVRADMKNLALFMRIAKRVAPGLDINSLAAEFAERTIEELDYEREAANQRELAELYRGHPFICVPDAVPELCSERVLVSEFVDGIGFEELKAGPAEVRNRVGEIVFRFYCGSLYRHGRFSGDPHPGNLRLLEDGRVAFLDFGLFKRMEPDSLELELACLRAAADGDGAEIHRRWTEAGVLPEPDKIDPEEVLAYVLDAVGWYLADTELELTPELATASFIESADPRSSYFEKLRFQHLPPEHLLSRRMEIFALALLGQLHPTANWHRIAREWLYGDEPVTELGRAEAEFLAPS